MDESKVCTKCGETKPLTDFHKHKSSRDGHATRCKDCRRAWNREYMRTYQHPDPDALGAYQERYRREHADEFKAYQKAYEERHGERLVEMARAYREANAEQIREAKRQYHLENAERIRAKVRRWQLDNPEHFRELLLRRRAQIVGTRVGPVDLAALWTGICPLCSEPIDLGLIHPDPLSKSVDHIVPLSKGGTHTQDNLQWTHLVCNLRKGAS